MSVQVTIDTATKRDAEAIAAELPGRPTASAQRGFGVIRLRIPRDREAQALVSVVEHCVERHAISWARVRVGDAEHMFRSLGSRAS